MFREVDNLHLTGHKVQNNKNRLIINIDILGQYKLMHTVIFANLSGSWVARK